MSFLRNFVGKCSQVISQKLAQNIVFKEKQFVNSISCYQFLMRREGIPYRQEQKEILIEKLFWVWEEPQLVMNQENLLIPRFQ